MKKRLFPIIAILAMAVMSCKKVVTVTPADPGTATIKGTLFAPLDLNNDTSATGVYTPGSNNEMAIAGIVVTALVDSKDLQKNPQNGFNYEILKYTTTVNDQGAFQFTNIPAYSDEITVELRFTDFQTVQTQFDPSNNPPLDKIFTLANQTVNVYDGAIVIKEYDYTSN